MASGSAGRANSGSKGYDFASDDILCSYDDFNNNQENSDGSYSDPAIGTNSTKEFHKSRMSRSTFVPSPVYKQQEEPLSQEMIALVERSMKKYADNLMRFLEGISSRLSQLELYCYNLDKSIGEMRSDLVRDHGEADSKLKSLEKHVQEVHRSVQILRDKQELAETQKELAKLQLAQKESSSTGHSSQTEERAPTPVSDSRKTDDTSDVHNQHLALALPHQVAPPPPPPPQSSRPVEPQQPIAPPSQAAPQNVAQPLPYYLPQTQLQGQSQPPQGQYVPSDPQYRTTQISQTPPPSQVHQFPQYQQQWPGSQPLPQQVQPSQQPQQPPSMPPQIRPQSSSVYPSYPSSQQVNPAPPDALPSSMPMQMPFSGIPPTSRAEVMPYGYGGRTPQQQPPPQQMKCSFGAQPSDGYTAMGPHASLSPGNAYMMYGAEEGRNHPPPQQPHFPQGGYPPSSVPVQNPQQSSMFHNPNPPKYIRNHPYNELIEKLVNMGFRGDHVMGVIQRMEESGQPIDFNAVLDRLNVHSSGGPQRGGWSG